MRPSTHTARKVAAAAAGQEVRGVKPPQRTILCGYLRLSVDRDGNKIGYEIQKKAIQEWAERNNFTIGRWYQDKDVTAADLSIERPGYQRMLADVEMGMWGGVIVWRLDRLVRLTREFAYLSNVTESTDTFIASISGDQQVDTRTSWGKFIMWLLVLLADMEIQTMKARNRAHQRAKAEAGKYKGGGPRPFGFVGAEKDENGNYLNSGKIGVEQIPFEAALLKEAAKRIAWDKWAWADVIHEWHSRTPPVYGSQGKPWNVYTLQRILTGPRIVGRREFLVEDPDTGEVEAKVVKAEWDPILDDETWLRLNSLLSSTEHSARETYLLSKFVLCGRCGHTLTGTQRKYKKQGVMTSTMTYRCKWGPASKVDGACGKLDVLAENVENIVTAIVLSRLKESPEVMEELRKQDSTVDQELDKELNNLVNCDNQLKELAEQYGLQEISMSEWLSARKPIESRRVDTKSRVERLSRALRAPTPSVSDQANLDAWFDSLTLHQQRTLIQLLVREVKVLPTGRNGRRFNPERVQVLLTGPDELDHLS